MRPILRVLLFVLALPSLAHAAPKAELWPRWQPFDVASTRAVDHAAWDAFLHRYVKVGAPYNRVAYKDVTADDRRALGGYLWALGKEKPTTLRRAEQLAYWINLYNALTVRVILDNYPVATIRDIDISPGFFSDGPWGKKIIEVEGEMLSLDDIEHRILRPIWKDPRIHYAVNCASIGCPDLMGAAYTAANVDAALTAAAERYINDPRGAKLVDGKLMVSSIYDWFRADFGGSEAGVLDHLRRYAKPALQDMLARVRIVDTYGYDWRLNE